MEWHSWFSHNWWNDFWIALILIWISDKSMTVMRVCLSVEVPFSDRQVTCLSGNVTTSLIGLIEIISRAQRNWEIFLAWVKYSTTRVPYRGRLTDCTASSILVIIKLSSAAKTASCSLVTAVWAILFTSQRTVTVISFSSVSISTWETLTIKIVSIEATFPPGVFILHSIGVS